ncbi:two-component system sensor histidine kinase NtrB [Glacieibacterium frigidum]|nr:ATP-binding protein [Glacieibacterium frigidum]
MSLAALRRLRPIPPAPSLDLVTALPVPVVALDAMDLPLLVNPAAESMLNTSAAMLADRGLAGLTVDDAAVADLLVHARAQGGRHSAFDVEIGFPGARTVRADLLIAPLADAPGALVLTLQTRSVASLVERQAVHRGAARSATGVAAMLAHEIKNPLSGIKGAAQLIAQGADPDTAELTDLICVEVDRIRDLVDRMEGFTDTRALPHAPENIHAVLGHVRKLAEQGFARGVRIAEAYDPSLPLVAAHRDSLVQVFLNLLKNAVEAAGSQGKIQLTTAFRHGLFVATPGSPRKVSLPIEVCVIDTGPGAPRDIADHLFDPFVTSKPGGRGLGLALVAKIVGDHGGIVEYGRENDRTVFRVLLPVAK